MIPFHLEATQALRTVRRGKGLTLAIIAVLGLGIGAVATAFSFLDAAFLRPLPYPHAEQLVALNQGWDDRITYGAVEARTLDALKQEDPESFTGIEAYRRATVRLTGDQGSTYLLAALVTPGLLPLVGVEPEFGNLSVDEAAVVLSNDLWENQFGADQAVAGEAVQLSGRDYRIAAVMPPHFAFPGFEKLWIIDPSLASGDRGVLNGIARLAPNATTSTARLELSRLAPRLAEGLGMDGIRIEVQNGVIERGGGGLEVIAWLLLSAGAVLLLLVSSNIASLLLVWNIRRRGEIAVRVAMGASRGRLLVRSLFECIILALAGGALGLLLAYGGMELLIAEVGGNFPHWFELRVDGRILMFTLMVALGSVAIFGLLPSLRASKVAIAQVLRGTSRGLTPDKKEHRVRGRFVAFQVALSTLLVSSSILLLNTADNLNDIEPGYSADDVLSLSIAVQEDMSGDPSEMTRLVRRVQGGIEEISTVGAVSYDGGIGGLPGGPIVGDSLRPLDQRVFIEGERVARLLNAPSSTRVVDSNYLEVLDLQVLDGRAFGATDTAGAPLVALVPLSVGRTLWPAESAVGQRLTLGADGPAIEVIGVIEDRNQILSGRDGIRVATVQDIYLSSAQALISYPSILVRGEQPPMELATVIDHRMTEMDFADVITDATTLGEEFRLTTSSTRAIGTVFGAVALASIFVCVVGLVGLIAQLVAERRREIGIRLAIGAEPRAVVRLIAGQGTRLAAVGTSVGLLLSASLSPLLGLFVFDANVWNPSHLAIVVLSVVGIAGLASLLPALRATRIHPREALSGD